MKTRAGVRQSRAATAVAFTPVAAPLWIMPAKRRRRTSRHPLNWYTQVPPSAGAQGVAAPPGQEQTSPELRGQSASIVHATRGVGATLVSYAAPVVASKVGSQVRFSSP